MQEQRISFGTAKLAKEKGFHWRTLLRTDPPYPGATVGRIAYSDAPHQQDYRNPCFSEEGKEISPKMYNPNNPHYPQPTQGLLARWIRERHNMHLVCGPIDEGKWEYFIFDLSGQSILTTDEMLNYASYEECMEAAIIEALNLIK